MKVKMMSETGRAGFTLIEVLVSVAIVAFSVVAIIEGYHRMVFAYQKARLESEGVRLLEERLVEKKIQIKSGESPVSESQNEGLFTWSVDLKETSGDLFELKGKIHPIGNEEKNIEVMTHVRK